MPAAGRGELGRAGAWGAGALGVLALIACCPRVLVGETLFLRDLGTFHRPLRRVLLDLAAAEGGLPLWNPLAHFGQPFAANPNAAVFHPSSALFFVLPFDLAFNLVILLPIAIGALGFAALVRAVDGSRRAAAFGALVWGLGGCTLSLSNFLQLHHCVALLPLSLALAVRLGRRPAPREAAGLALTLGLQGLAGSPTGLLATALLVPVAALDGRRRAPVDERAAMRRVALASLAAAVLGLAVGAATLLPAAAHLRETGRVADGGFADEAEGWSLPPARLVELAAPRALGRIVPEAVGWYWGRSLYGWRQWPYLFSIYSGLAALVLAAVAVRRGAARDAPWILVGLGGLVLALGSWLPGWGAVTALVPPLAVVRFPEKWVLVPSLVLALLAARGLDLALADEGALALARRLASLLAAVLAAAAVSVVAVEAFGGAAAWSSLLGAPDWLAPLVGPALARDLALQVSLALVLRLVLALPGGRWSSRAGPALLVLVAVDLGLAGRSLLPTVPPAHLDEPPRVLRALAARPPDGYLFHYADWKGHDERRAGRALPTEAPVPWQWGIATGLEKDFDGTQLAWSRAATRELLELMAAEPELVGPLLARRSVVAVLSGGRGRELELLATAAPRPLVFPAERVVVPEAGESRAAVLRRLGGLAAGAVVLERGSAGPSVRPGAAAVTVLERRPDALRVRAIVTARAPAMLAVNVTWSPRWRARLDGGEAELLRADGHLCAIAVPPGEHVVELAYRDPLVTAGLALSVLGLAAAGLLARRRGAA